MEDKHFSNTDRAFHHLPDRELKRALSIFSFLKYPAVVKVFLKLFRLGQTLRLPVWRVVPHSIYDHFCAGSSTNVAILALRAHAHRGVGVCLSYCVEGLSDKKIFDREACELNRDLILRLRQESEAPFASVAIKVSGLLKASLLGKMQFGEELSAIEHQKIEEFNSVIETLCWESMSSAIPVMFDAEESWVQDTIDALVLRLMKKHNQKAPIVYTTVQMYRVDRLKYLESLIKKARREKFFIGIKLVRGAYLEQEIEHSIKAQRDSMVLTHKAHSDEQFNMALRLCFKNLDCLALFVGTHNRASTKLFCGLYEKLENPRERERVVISQLYGMGDTLTYSLSNSKYPVCKYVPFGPRKEVIPYLVRRAEENLSILGETNRERDLLKQEVERRKNLIRAGSPPRA